MRIMIQIIKCDPHYENTQILSPQNQKFEKRVFKGKVKGFFFVLLLLLLAGSGFAWASSDTPESKEAAGVGQLFHFYKTVISATDGDRCGMSPSCSSYAAQAFKKHGLFMGWIISCDRLIRCGRDETRLSPHVQSGKRVFTKDTLEDNDFWWYPGK